MHTRFLIWIPVGVFGLLFATLSVVSAFPPNSSPWLSRPGSSDNTEAAEYYATTGAPATLSLWKSAYGFTDSNDIDAIYYNAGDLGFGREMHCRKSGLDVACYVVNHGLGAGGPIQPSIAAAIANQNNLPTVAMVYHDAQNGSPNDVTFYIYDPAGNRLTGVALDSEGDKFVPNMCLACHGGSYDSTSNTTSGANFLPFDTESFHYSPQSGYTLADQQESFRQLNALVRDANPTASITELIDGWYAAGGGVTITGSVPNNNFVPVGYASNTGLYDNVFKHYCRSCHTAQTAYSFSDPAQLLGNAGYAVFHVFDRPHAELTSHNFWNSPAPAYLANSGNWSYRVTRLDDPAPDGCNPGDCSLREAILAANSPPPAPVFKSIITFDVDGVFTLTRSGNDDLGSLGDLDITTEVILLGNGPEQTIIDGGGIDRLFHIVGGAGAVIQNVTLQNGQTSSWGAGIYNDGSRLTRNNSVVKDNVATAPPNPYLSTDVPKAILSTGAPVVTSTLTIAGGGGVIVDLNVVNLNGSHTYIGDLSFILQSPAGTQVEIMAQSCGSEDNFNIHLDDEAAPGVWPCPPTDGGTYPPSNPLSVFDGENSAGIWTLIVTDHADQDGGSLNGWGLEIVSRYISADVPRAILSVGMPVVTSTLTIAGGGGVIADLNVVNLNGAHTWIYDLSFILQSPAGTQVEIMTQSCGSEDNFNIHLDDEAAFGVWPCPPTDGGTYLPSNPLSVFDGENSAGIWTLIVTDHADQDGGSLNGWGLEIALVTGEGKGAGIANRNNAITEINYSAVGPNNVSSDQGGGLYNENSTVTLNSSAVSGNGAGAGGGLYNSGFASTTLNASTLTGNAALNMGGGVSNADSASLFVRNTLIAGNAGGGSIDCANASTYTSQGYNLVGQNGNANGCPTDGTTLILAGAITTALNPNLSSVPGRTPYHALVRGGPAVDAIPLGGNCTLPSYDQLNLARPQGGACDIGAHEAPTLTLIFLPLALRGP